MTALRPFMLLVGFALLTLPLMPVQQVFVWTWPAMARRFPHAYHKLVARLLGFTIRIEGEVPAKGPALLAANHVSWIDIVVMSAAAPVSFVAKADVNRWPFFGSLARLQRTVFVDRERRVTTAGSRDEMAERLKAGDLLVLFAEGTSGDGARVLPFKSAFFGAAETEGIPVHPVTLAYTHHRNMPMTRRQRPSYAWYGDMDLPPHLWEALAMGPVTVTLRFHPPETTHAHGGRKQLARHAETRVRAGLVDLLHGPGKMG